MRHTEHQQMSKYTAGFGLALAAAALVNAFLVIVKETNPGVRQWMADTAAHHWIAHTIAVVAVFVILGFLHTGFGLARRLSPRALLAIVTSSIIVGSLSIMVFYVLHASDTY